MVEMDEEDAQQQQQQQPHVPVVGNDPNNPLPIDNRHHNIVSAGESAAGEPDDFSTTDDDEERAYRRWDPSRSGSNDENAAEGMQMHDDPSSGGNPVDFLYDANLDQEDEAYVYKHMRGGIQESVAIRRTTTASTRLPSSDPTLGEDSDVGAVRQQQQQQQQQSRSRSQTLPMYKPRNSDAVLSCPCCFNIVCMDCQKHKRYANQYRAMFVMGVTVDWNHILVYDDAHRGLVSRIEPGGSLPLPATATVTTSDSVHSHQTNPMLRAGDGEYYAVECATCGTQVAALDMRDEVYHFHGCLESS